MQLRAVRRTSSLADDLRGPARALRERLRLCAVCVALLCVPMLLVVNDPSLGDWRFLAAGVEGLRDDGLALYARNPVIQVGPLGLLLAAPFVRAPELASLVAAAAYPALVVLVTPARVQRARHAVGWLLCVLAGAVPWTLLSWSGHLDDVAATAGTVLALRWLRSHPGRAGLALGLAIAAKPWALVAAPVLLRARGPRAVLTAVGVAGLAWAPFLLAAPGTLGAGKVQFAVWDTSLWGVLGMDGQYAPSWFRAAQLAACWAVCVVFARRRTPATAVAAAHVVRFVTDPGSGPYYTAPLVVLALLADTAEGRSWPRLGSISSFFVAALPASGPPLARAGLRAGLSALFLATAAQPAEASPRGQPAQPCDDRPASSDSPYTAR